MKTKMKTIFSVCILSIFLYACSKDNSTPDPVSGCIDDTAFNYDSLATVDDGSCCMIAGCIDSLASNFNQEACYDDNSCTYAFTDCMEVENGVAVVDSCGDCQGAYIYNMVTHDPSEIVMLGGDTTGASATLTSGQVIIFPEDPGNPYWNAGCTQAIVYDCMGVQNGVAVVDSCGDCQGAYIYNMATHDPSEIVMLGGDTTGASATLTPGQVIIFPEDPGNPYWNAGCK